MSAEGSSSGGDDGGRGRPRAQTADDDLESLGSGLEAGSEAVADGEDELDFASLSGVASSRSLSSPGTSRAAPESDGDQRIDLADAPAPSVRPPAPAAEHSTPQMVERSLASGGAAREATPAAEAPPAAAAAPAAAPKGPHWTLPLLFGLALGLGVAFVFTLRGREPSALEAAEAASPRAEPTDRQHPAPTSIASPPAPTTTPAAVTGEPASPAPAPFAPASADRAPLRDEAAPASAPAPAPTAQAAAVLASRAKPAPAAPEPPPQPDAPDTIAPKPDEATPQAHAKSPEAAPELLPQQERVDALLDEALSGKAKPQDKDPFAHAQLPESPSRDEVMAAMQVILPALRGCAMGQAGAASAGIVVRSDGRVASVEVAGAPFAGSASGRCMEGVIRRARFPRFRAPTFRVRFPFSIQ